MKILVNRSIALLLTLALLLTMTPFTALSEAEENEDGMDGIMDILETNEEETDLTVSSDVTEIIDECNADGDVFPDSPDDPGLEDDWNDWYTDDSDDGDNTEGSWENEEYWEESSDPISVQGEDDLTLEDAISGSGKTRFFVLGNLLQCHSSYIVTDPKGDLIVRCGSLLRKKGYRIKVLNTINFKKSMHYRLYDLTTLQRDANRIFGYTAQQTLDYAQDLYEKKLITYPRTDSPFLTEDMQLLLPDLVHRTANCLPYIAGMQLPVHAEQVINNAKVSDHHAIIPTKTMTVTPWLGLPAQEKALLELICIRLICAVSDPYEYAETVVTVECEGHTFTGKGKTVSQIGWKLPYELFMRSRKQENNDTEDEGLEPVRSIQTLEIGEKLYPVMASVKDGVTVPPKHYTEDSLLAAMETAGVEDMPEDAERKGLGTPATRAGILEKLVQAGLVIRRGAGKQQNLLPTDKGKALIAVTPDILKSPILTAEWEQRLKAIEHGEEEPSVFLAQIADLLKDMCQTAKPVTNMEQVFPSKRERIGACPSCGAPVSVYPRGYFCENRICPFAIWKDNRFFTTKKKNISKELVKALLEKRQADMTDLYSEKTGKLYNARVLLETDQKGRARFKLQYPQQEKKKENEVSR